MKSLKLGKSLIFGAPHLKIKISLKQLELPKDHLLTYFLYNRSIWSLHLHLGKLENMDSPTPHFKKSTFRIVNFLIFGTAPPLLDFFHFLIFYKSIKQQDLPTPVWHGTILSNNTKILVFKSCKRLLKLSQNNYSQSVQFLCALQQPLKVKRETFVKIQTCIKFHNISHFNALNY